MKHSQVCVIGGTGFVGGHLINALSAAGHECRVPTRNPERHRDLRLVPDCRLHKVEDWGVASLRGALEGCDTVVYLVGILNETGGRTFEQAHVRRVETVREAAAAAGVRRWLHMSALHANAERGPSEYLRTKGLGEAAAFAAAQQGIAVTSFRPSVIFGRGDSFFNRFAGLLRVLPGPFPLACAGARFAPVYVGDVCNAMVTCLEDPATAGHTYELCGPRTFTLRELVEYTGERIGRRVRVIPLGDTLARLQGKVFQMLPGKPFSMDNYLSLQVDSVCNRDGLGALGLSATDVDAVVPAYLG
jgi:NADH dehydrogenase